MSKHKVETMQITPSHLPASGISKKFSVSPATLAKWRFERRGPECLRLGHRTVLYSVEDFQKWLDTQPRGGGQIRVPAKEKQPRRKKRKAA